MKPSDEGQILSVAVPRPLDGLFTYRISGEMAGEVRVGGWVRVPFGRTVTHAFVVEEPKPLSDLAPSLAPESLKEVLEVSGAEIIFPRDVLELCRWAHDYYLSPLGEILHAAAPPAAMGLKSTKKQARPMSEHAQEFTPERHQLTPQQQKAFDLLEELRATPAPRKVGVLHGVTGSGKTEIYLELARRALAQGKGVLLLVPEIALTSQLHRRFEAGLGVPVGLWHSAVADGKRRDIGAALRSGELRVAVGARSAVFAPIKDLGLIIVDEEHDPTYKQEDRARYHARDLAVVRGKISDAFVVLGSATPSLETRERVAEGRYAVARLDERIAPGGLPRVEIVDLTVEERAEGTQAPLALSTIRALQETLDAGEQAIVFLNRRGFASFLVCEDCGETPGCPLCSISLTVHKKKGELRCHVCGHAAPIPDFCAKCMSTELKPVGAGTESLEDELPKFVTGMKTLRLDRDHVTSATRLDSILADFRAGKANVLLGTQMLAKGHDFPGVTLVVVVLADALFRWPDFRAPERACQILKQVAGRAGRGDRPGRVLIQAFDVDHPVLQVTRGTLSEDVFLEGERELRRALGYPPFGRLARVRFESPEAAEAQARSTAAADALRRAGFAGVEILGPSEAFLERAKGIYRWDLLIKAKEVGGLQRALLSARSLCQAKKWPLLADVDPQGVG